MVATAITNPRFVQVNTHGLPKSMLCISSVWAVCGLSWQCMDCCSKHGSMLWAAQSVDCPDPCFEPNIYISTAVSTRGVIINHNFQAVIFLERSARTMREPFSVLFRLTIVLHLYEVIHTSFSAHQLYNPYCIYSPLFWGSPVKPVGKPFWQAPTS